MHDHLNDLICIPFWVPIMLWGQRRLGLAGVDRPPMASEILLPLFVWSWFFEMILPSSRLPGVSLRRGLSGYPLLFSRRSAGGNVLGLVVQVWPSHASSLAPPLPATSVSR